MSCLRQAGIASVNESPEVSCKSPSSKSSRHSNHLGLDGFEEDFCKSSFDPLELMQVLCRTFWSCHTGLNAFVKASLASPTCTVQKNPSGSLWPVPPVRWSWTAITRPSPKRRRRQRYHAVRTELLNLLICALNWETLGHPKRPPPSAQLGATISVQQHCIIERLEAMLDHFLHMSPFDGVDLGRASGKFEGLIKSLSSLPICEMNHEDLTDLLSSLHGSFDPYSSHFANHETGKPKEADPDHSCDFVAGRGTATVTIPGAKPVISSRVKWENPPSFEAVDYLGPGVKEAFEDPEVLRKPKPWPPARPARMHISRDEFLKLVFRWDKLGACKLVESSEKDYAEAVGIFAVDKDADFDRLIINPKTINSRMHSISDATQDLAPGCMLGLLHLPEGFMYRFSADDLTDFYYTFKVSDRRALRNCFRMKFQAAELSQLSCFDPLKHSGKELMVCLSTLAMGDSLAVEIAQQSHGNVLRVCAGSMDPSEVLRYRWPVPRGSFIELLAIDDHVGIQRLPIKDYHSNPSLRDTKVFRNAECAYRKVGLVQHEKKRKRNETQGVILGADFDGIAGKVMAPRQRVAILSAITMHLVRIGTCTRKLLSVLLGCWIHVLLFRRVIFAVVDQLFREGLNRDPEEVFCISRQGRCELQMLALLSPIAQSDLRAKYSDKLFCTDASPEGGAVTYADVNQIVSQELWRHCEQRGFYTKLQSPVASYLEEKGIEPESNFQFTQPSIATLDAVSTCIPSPLSEGILFDCLEIFCGSGNWSSAHLARGFRVHDGIDVEGRRLRYVDMANPSAFHELVSLALRRVVRDWHAGVPCPSFGALRRPQVRSKSFPAGFDPNDPYTHYHNTLARRTAFVLTIALQLGQYVSIEQPGSSRLFLLHCYRVMVMLGCVISHFCFCHYGSAFKKPSKWLHNKPWIVPLECGCTCPWRNKHFVVQGSFTKSNLGDFLKRCRPSCEAVYGKVPKVGDVVSSFSAAYPYRLVQEMATGLERAVRGSPGLISLEVKHRSLCEVGLDPQIAIPSRSGEPAYPTRPWYEDPEWINELCEGLQFHEMFRYRFKKAGHINVNEARTYKSLIKAAAKTEVNSRFLGLLDSRVTIGAASKGRSSSFAISRVLQGSVAYILGSNLYPGLLHCYSGANRSDGPSRGRDVEPPTRALPDWFLQLAGGDYRKFDAVVCSSRYSKNPARWLRFLLLLCGDIERNPGPKRGKMNLNIGFVKATSERMIKCLSAFQRWVVEHAQLPFDQLAADPQGLSWALRAYGLYLFEHGLPRYLLVYSITACQDVYPACKPYMNIAWQIDRKWQLHEPGSCRAVLPAVVVRAMACVGALWNWLSWTAVFLLGFAGMLHPSEMLSLVRKDLVFPSDLNHESGALYLRVRDPKTARFARRQHSRIDDESIIQIAEAAFGKLPLESRLYAGSAHTFRRQWDAILQRLRVPFRQKDHGATPGVLRGSGATWYYCATENLSWVAWRGRWSRQKTLEFYLQEVGSQMLIHELDPLSKSLIFQLADASFAVLWRQFDLAGQDRKSGEQ